MYSFNWSKTNHIEYQRQNLKCSRFLWRYLNRISKGQYPQRWFNDYSVCRISKFRLKGLKRGLVPKIGRQLVKEGIIKEYGPNHELSRMTNQVFTNFTKAKIERKPGHDVILKNILIRDDKSIATEVPVWYEKPEKITGHIDLVRIHGDFVEVCDYKPEGNFMRSIPQVAYYGVVLKRQLNLPYVVCASFNRDNLWEYEPMTLFNRLDSLLDEIEADEYKWQYFI